MANLRMELHAGQPTGDVLERRDRRALTRRHHLEAGRRGHAGVAVRHPHRLLDRQPAQQPARRRHRERRAAVLRAAGVCDLPTEGLRHELEAVADAEDRHLRIEEAGRRLRSAVGVHRGGAAGQDDRRGFAGEHLLHRQVRRDDLAEDVRFADPPGDQLCVLRAEVDNENRVETHACPSAGYAGPSLASPAHGL